ncbi:hypothetical protein [Clostridium estertheticum]|nr:hypothetical protein [Clostridium estertheticum]MCB2306192.1 hypothetical protein [Clostridium estertheticum]MCB2344365.1 hypothetical protein [Clostridium estertheticum]
MSQKYGQPGNSDIGPRLTKDWLESLEVDDVTINKITMIIRTMSVKVD